ncbi:hypothetical protein ACQ86O_08250 [Serratia sp. L9]|uniref:hypothetical protein n=1 Tax=Serratia sp. L9 TaxID=3423946 RepID=UPI003D66B75E
MQKCAKFHIFLWRKRLALCVKRQPNGGKKIEVMTVWLANVIRIDKNCSEQDVLADLFLCRCIKDWGSFANLQH